jgi:hypothetical protein
MTVNQFLDYLASHSQSRDLALNLAELLDTRETSTYRRTA